MRKLTIGKQLLLTLWKFGVQFQCNWKKFLVETIAKVALIYILSFIVSGGVKIDVEQGFNSAENLFIMYFPSNNYTDALIANYANNARTPGSSVQSYPSEIMLAKDWDERINGEPENDNNVAIIFNEATDETLDYTIRIGEIPGLKYHLTQTFHVDDKLFQECIQRILALQMVLESSYIKKLSGVSIDEVDPKPLMTTIEYTTEHKAMLLLRFTGWTGLFICTTLFRGIMEEKESGLKLYQNILGVSSYMLWIGRMIDMALKAMLSNAAVAYAMTYVIRFDWWLLWLYLTLYSLKAAAFLFFMSVWFQRAITALIFVAVLWTTVGNIGKFLIIYSYEFSVKTTRLIFAFVFPNVGLALGFYNIAKIEMFMGDVSFESKSEEHQFLSIMGLMLAATIFFLTLTFYLDPIWEHETGATWKPWPLKRKYRGGSGTPRGSVVEVDYVLPVPESGFQNPPLPAVPVVRLRGISKSYKNVKVLNNISMDFYTNEVTLLLGENGSGKSTIIALITGESVPNHGTVYVHSHNIRVVDELSLIRSNIGWCPQKNIFISCMTIKQLLTYAGKLRGMDRVDNDEQVNYLLDALSIRMVAHMRPASTVPSIRRLVSFAFAVMGRSPILLLDEPASGIDIEGRRLMWKVIKDLRKHRVILIASNHTDKVDEIADRAVIIKNAKICCWGSPQFLKNAFGVNGFRIFVEPGSKVSVSTIKRAVRHYFPEAKRVSGHLHPMQFVLPHSPFNRLDRLLTALERLGTLRLSCAPSTMDDVFMHVTRVKRRTPDPTIHKKATVVYPTKLSYERPKEATYFEQFCALCKKEFILLKRSWVLYFAAVLVQIFVIASIIMVSEWRIFPKSIDSEKYSLESYPGTVLYQSDTHSAMEASYYELAREFQSKVVHVSDLNDFVERSMKKDRLEFVYEHYIAAIIAQETGEGGQKMGTPFFNPVGTYTPMVSVNLLNNAILRTLGFRQAKIVFNSHPFHHHQFFIVANLLSESLWGELMVIVLFLWMTAFGFPVYEEKVTGSFRLQSLAGATSVMYWLSRYVCHITLYALLTCILLVTTVTGGINMFSCPSSAGALVVIWLLFGLAAIPFIYVLTILFPELFDVVNALIALVVSMSIFFHFESKFPDLAYYHNKYLKYFLMLLPNYNARQALLKLYNNIVEDSPCRLQQADTCPMGYTNKTFQQRECLIPRYYLNYCVENVLALIVTCFLYLALLIWWDTKPMWLCRLRKELAANYAHVSRLREKDKGDAVIPDSDVVKERVLAQVAFSRMTEMPTGYNFVLPPPNMMVANELVLRFRRLGKLSMVAGRGGGVSLRVPSATCLGLLGGDRSDRGLLLHLLGGLVLPTNGDVAGIACRLSENRSSWQTLVSFLLLMVSFLS